MPASRSATPSAVSATHSPSQPAASAAAATGDGAVAVAVGLDDGPHRRRRDGGPRSTPTLWATASRSISAHAQRAGRRRSVIRAARARSGSVSRRSPATRPDRRAEPGRLGVDPRRRRPPRRTAAMPVASSAPMMPARTSPVPAVASRASPDATTRTSPPGSATTVAGPLSSTTAPVSAASRRAAAMRSAPGRLAGEQAELAVVRRQHGRVARAGAAAAPAPSGSTPWRTARRRRPRPAPWRRRRSPGRPSTVYSSRPSPGPTTSAWIAVEVVEHGGRPVERRQAAADDLGRRRRLDAGARQRHHPAAGPLRRAGGEVGGAGHAGAAGDDPHGPRPLVRRRRARPPPAGDVVEPRRGRRARRLVSRPMSTTSTSPASTRPAPSSRPGLRAANVTVRSAGSDAAAGLAGEPVDAARDVDGEHRRGADARRPPLAVEPGAVGGVDDEVGGGQARRAVGGVEQADPHAALGQRARRGPAVGAVVALAGDHVDRSPVRAAEHLAGHPGDGRPGPLDEHLDRLGRGRVDRRHLVRRDDRDHGQRPSASRSGSAMRHSATTIATATGPSWLIDRCQRTTPRSTASSPGPPGDDEATARRTPRPRPTPRGTRTRRGRGRAPSSPPPGRRSGRPATAPGRPWARRSPARRP